MLLSKINNRYISYVGYTKDLNKRVLLHNNSKGAKFTKGNFWKIIYKKKYLTKNIAMVEEYKLKKNYKKRSLIKYEYLKKFHN
jgi:putative endonuclease